MHLATVGRLVRGTALMIPLCAWRACAQQPPLESVWGTNTLLNMVRNVAKEFWPDFRRKIHRQKPAD